MTDPKDKDKAYSIFDSIFNKDYSSSNSSDDSKSKSNDSDNDSKDSTSYSIFNLFGNKKSTPDDE